MLKNRKAQGLPITTIILVVIGLVVLVVLIAILTGKIGLFSKGVESAASCKNTCTALGYDNSAVGIFAKSEIDCNALPKSKVVPGTFGDITGETSDGAKRICCCSSSLG